MFSLYWEYYLMGIILIPGIILSIYAQTKVNSTFHKFSESYAECGKTAGEIARLFLDNAGLTNISVSRIKGSLTDNYNHRKKTVYLSDDVYDNTSVAAIGVACHEVGHALQYKTRYLPISLRNFMIPVFNFSNHFVFILLILGVIFYAIPFGVTMLWIGIGIFALSVIINLVTLPVEYNASNRALQLLEKSTILNQTEVNQAGQVLKAAALTYVAALVVSILNLLRIIFVLFRRVDKD